MTDQPNGGRFVLLDEMLPRLLARELPDHRVTTVPAQGWTGIVNGELLKRAEAAGVEVFVTADRKMEHQQRLAAELPAWSWSLPAAPSSKTCGSSPQPCETPCRR